MNKYTFSSQSGKAYYCNSIPGFIKDTSASVVGQLVRHTVKFHAFDITTEQEEAWENQITELQNRLEKHGIEGISSLSMILFAWVRELMLFY